MTRVTLDNVTLSYARHAAVHHVSGVFESGSLTAVAGPNGAGKSTLLKAIAGIMRPEEGRIQVKDGSIAYLPQASELRRDFPLTLEHLVATGYWHKTGGLKTINAAMKRSIAAALAEVGLQGFGRRALSSLSAGQFQRALFARLLLQDASLILLDEPFNAVDAHTTARLLEVIKSWHEQGRTVICVLHDFEQIRRHFPQCLLLARECLAWGPSESTLAPERVQAMRYFREQGRVEQACERAAL